MAVHHIPEGYHSVTPYLIIAGAADAIEYYKQAFGAVEIFRMADPKGGVGHAELKIGNSHIMMGDEQPAMGYQGPKALGGTPVSLMLYVEDVDKVFAAAMELGGKELNGVKDQFYGDRSGTLEDPFGHKWTIATHKEEVSPEEMERRLAKAMGGS